MTQCYQVWHHNFISYKRSKLNYLNVNRTKYYFNSNKFYKYNYFCEEYIKGYVQEKEGQKLKLLYGKTWCMYYTSPEYICLSLSSYKKLVDLYSQITCLDSPSTVHIYVILLGWNTHKHTSDRSSSKYLKPEVADFYSQKTCFQICLLFIN